MRRLLAGEVAWIRVETEREDVLELSRVTSGHER